ncbi:MAG: hypothetical protein IJ764_03125 [Bacteroidales bacterium]|nr:hypothetical protein [Bacteroidales bacterium]
MSLKEFFQQDKTIIGVIAVIIAELIFIGLLSVVCLVTGTPPFTHPRWYAGAALPALLIVRAYAKHKDALSATKGAIITLFVTFVAFLMYLIKNKLL